MNFRTVVKMMAPRTISVCGEELPVLAQGQVEVRTLYTAISSGTEMLAYRGQMPDEIVADATISTLQKPFSYPISYGYCNVGRIVALSSASSAFRVGDLVFAFREHASGLVSAEGDLLRVPPWISARDACLLPAVETAVSVAMDAALLPGESAVVVGQGCIGLMVTACLKLLHPLSTVTTVDIDEDRRRLSVTAAHADASFGADVTVQAIGARDPFNGAGGADVAIDTSGQGAGLDKAIELTRDGGKVVLASWFGSKHVQLTSLGGRFHRSHISIVASQVSEIPAAIRARWSKQRRFALAWRLLALIKPSECFPVTVANVADAARIYEEIDSGKHLQVIFKYHDGNGDAKSQ